ncbi:hypothetical protein BKA63DRAFT_573466 [Paraphoma chrysanthemicola]|nr:hypothetical protein BKA63DRAFT_573466 [Paraphoma chrysanthemicola]
MSLNLGITPSLGVKDATPATGRPSKIATPDRRTRDGIPFEDRKRDRRRRSPSGATTRDSRADPLQALSAPSRRQPHLSPSAPKDEPVQPTSIAGTETVVRFKLNDIKVFTGDCDSIPEDRQVEYRESRIDGAAWDFIDNLEPAHFLDVLQALDPYFAQNMWEKVQAANRTLTDLTMPLTQKSDEAFATWRDRFMAVKKVLKHDNQFMLGEARKFMRPVLAKAASAGFDDQQPNTLMKFLDAARQAENTELQINMGKRRPRRASQRVASVEDDMRRDRPRLRAPQNNAKS